MEELKKAIEIWDGVYKTYKNYSLYNFELGAWHWHTNNAQEQYINELVAAGICDKLECALIEKKPENVNHLVYEILTGQHKLQKLLNKG